MITSQQQEIIERCRVSVSWFIRNFCKVKHPSAGLLPFTPFKYQLSALKKFRENRFVIFRKCRQAGISKIAGAYALWLSMLHTHKTVLIVSRTDPDAMTFMHENIILLFRHLPTWMQALWTPVKSNEHEVVFPSGSRIRSLSSNPDVLRSNASSLNIIDECAFIPHADMLWAAGYPTLQHGGSVVLISTTNGVGNFYWSKWTDAEAGVGEFVPISVLWWDMDWVIEYTDPISLKHIRIAPTDNIVTCNNAILKTEKFGDIRLDPEKYGPYWSPWLEEQYRELQDRGESWRFEQEILASFVGSGNTVLSKSVINYVDTTVTVPIKRISGLQQHVHPLTGDLSHIDFTPKGDNDGLWIWKPPVEATPAKYRDKELIEPGTPAHTYVMGVDLSTGKSRDYHAIEVFDVGTMEQVAEYMGHCLPRDFKKVVDRIGRWYNCALAVIERNNGGDAFIDEMLHDMIYPRVWRKRTINDKPRASSNSNTIVLGQYGFFTSIATKPTLNKCLLDFIRDQPGQGYTIYSGRLHKQMQTYVRKQDRAGKDTGRTEAEDGSGNYDDLIMACGLAIIGAPDAVDVDTTSLIPKIGSDFMSTPASPGQASQPEPPRDVLEQKFISMGGPALLIPLSVQPDAPVDQSAMDQLNKFALQLGGIPISNNEPLQPVATKRHIIDTVRFGGGPTKK